MMNRTLGHQLEMLHRYLALRLALDTRSSTQLDRVANASLSLALWTQLGTVKSGNGTTHHTHAAAMLGTLATLLDP